MTHQFEVDDANKYGVNAAIILTNLRFWVQKNQANEKHYYDGRYWTYNSVSAFSELFPYLTEKQIRTAIDKLVEAGEVEKGNYNQNPYDRTLWYTVKRTRSNGKVDLTIEENTFAPEVKSYIGTDNKPDGKPYIIEENPSNTSVIGKVFPAAEWFEQMIPVSESGISWAYFAKQWSATGGFTPKPFQIKDRAKLFCEQQEKEHGNPQKKLMEWHNHFRNWLKYQNFNEQKPLP